MTLSEFGTRLRACTESCADELSDLVPPWSDQQRHDIERAILVHLLAAHAWGLRDASRRLRLDTDLPPDLRGRMADAVEAMVADRREFL